jgi:hypothetical protein
LPYTCQIHKTKKVPEINPGPFYFNPTSNYFLLLVALVEVAVELVFVSFVQEPPFLQHFLSVQVLVVALLSLVVEADCCCAKAKPVIPTIATAKINFFILFSFMG